MLLVNAVAAGSSTAAHGVTITGSGAIPSRELDKDAFLLLLVTQLQHQDPSRPMEDREFIAQMAQFSALEQMTNVRDGLDILTHMQITTQALTLVGKSVTLRNPGSEEPLTGTVSEVRFVSGEPRLVVDGHEYGLADILSVK